MKLIVITVDEQGKTTLTPEQLRTLIDIAYKEGYADGCQNRRPKPPMEVTVD